jgi:ABC-type uncharacterized transport system substrate-binding protein
MITPRNSDHCKPLSLLISILVLAAILAACAPAPVVMEPAPLATAAPTAAVAQFQYFGKKVVYINSYHEGYAWSDGIEAGLHGVFDGTGVELKIIRLDTKNNPDPAFGQAAGVEAAEQIAAYKPDVVIASDDNAQKYVVVPHLKGGSIPIIFNGVNWDASAYGYSPEMGVTGMIEVELPDQMVELISTYAKGNRLAYITVDSETERKVVDIYNQRFFNGEMQTYWVTNQDEFKAAYLQAQTEVDMLFMGNNAGTPWDAAEMQNYVVANATIPTGSINDWMAPYSLLTLAKSPREQGEWSARTALELFEGIPVANIPFGENKQGDLIVNLIIADKLGVVFSPTLLKNAQIIDE